MAEASLAAVTKRFGETIAVDDVDLTIANGEFIVLLGPTGAGKTTLLRLIAGLETPDSGTVAIGGGDVTSLAPAMRDVAFVFQQYSLYPHYTVFENLAFPLRAPGRRMGEQAIRKRVSEIAEMLRIGHKLKNKATQLSGGEMQRVSIGRALVREPNVFLMDEPLSSLDAKLREDLRVELKRIQRDLGATIVYVTHDQLEAMTLADRIGILDRGRLVQVDEPRTIYERPATVYAAQRLGSPQINLLPAGRLGLTPGSASAITAGVRPEDVEVGTPGGFDARVIAVERRGAEMIALLEVDGGQQVHALLDAHRPVGEGASLQVAVRPGAPVWFDREQHLVNT
ncbi:ATP-binding cassette domain-containing protein [Stappia sp. GBMRC 2046]|uniref:ATP-binding cassette domain-containing protein n=1 Tax=Stappia sediminis TaxID=2692190 RepID=A0A7X3LSP8_9HYPH|nr:ABC transporter ATP-binding protein [Stappia sediminis]MXN64371.1 ATP-binding cassette domain-containing protein [Stappia sediminis]